MENLYPNVSLKKNLFFGLSLSALAILGWTKEVRSSYQEVYASEDSLLRTGTADTVSVSQELFIHDAIQKLSEEVPEKWLENPYIPATFYYSNSYYHNLDKRNVATPHEEIFSVLKDFRDSLHISCYQEYLKSQCEMNSRYMLTLDFVSKPLEVYHFGGKIWKGHQDAIDLYAPLGSPVFAMKSGIVVLAESGWDLEAPQSLSTTSPRGGNSVILYHPQDGTYTRYAHLYEVFSQPLDVIVSGESLGTVGKTGERAADLSKESHLHFEMNRMDSQGGSEVVPTPILQELLSKLH